MVNTWWGLQALAALGEKPQARADLVEWVQSCQRPGGGFLYAPRPELAPVEQAVYTWAALRCLQALGAGPRDPKACLAWLHSLRNPDGGYGDRPGRESNPCATFCVLDALPMLGSKPAAPKPRRTARSRPMPADLKAFTAQIEAPGTGSPAEAVELARALGIHLWGGKNAAPAWIARCQEIADRRKVPVRFFPANEEYGTYVSVPGLGTYSHLADVIAPPGVDFGASMADPKKPVPWTRFRDERLAALRRAGGGNVWQFNENEELTRVLLDEAVESGTYCAISSYHFGNENFLNSQPYLERYHDALPFVALQDAHARESWWWAEQLAGFRTVFLAREPTWEAWMEALRERRVVAVRHDEMSGFKTWYAGGTKEARRTVMERFRPEEIARPAASLVLLNAGDPFEAGAPESGAAARLRLWRRNSKAGSPLAPMVELVELAIDGAPVKPELKETKGARGGDSYYIAPVPAGVKAVSATVREIKGGREHRVTAI